MQDPEIAMMSGVNDALSATDDPEMRSRVLRWAAERFGVALPQPNGAAAHHARASGNDIGESDAASGAESARRTNTSANGASAEPLTFEHFAELFDAVQPKSDVEKALTAAYWEQVIQGHNDWQSYTLGKALRNLGHNLSNITASLTAAMKRKPALVLQLNKKGGGRKTYKLSAEGLKYIRERVM